MYIPDKINNIYIFFVFFRYSAIRTYDYVVLDSGMY
jgi:hypothetical protein